jgi:hypothetical protein
MLLLLVRYALSQMHYYWLPALLLRVVPLAGHPLPAAAAPAPTPGTAPVPQQDGQYVSAQGVFDAGL